MSAASEIRKERDKLEAELRNMLNAFEQSTGTVVRDIHFERCHRIGEARGEIMQCYIDSEIPHLRLV